MKTLKKVSVGMVLALALVFGLSGLLATYAASTPSLGMASTFGILSSTYTNTVGGTTIDGDLGYTTGPAVTPTVNGTTFSPPDSEYTTAGTDQGAALTDLNSQACTHIFPAGAVDLATDTSHGTIGVYEPGVYCTTATSAASIGAGGITLSGGGTYIFRINGALTTVANSVVTLADGASPCDVFWTPTEATTLGANSIFVGTNIDDSGITIGSTVDWTGQALAFGGTVSTDTDTITVPVCEASLATLHVIKTVVNDDGGTAVVGDFDLYVKDSDGDDVTGSPAAGTASPGTSYSLVEGTYVVSEDSNSSYARSFSGDCDASGNVTLVAGDDKTCTITNNDIAGIEGDEETIVPALPKTGSSLKEGNIPWNIVIPVGLILASISVVMVLKKRII